MIAWLEGKVIMVRNIKKNIAPGIEKPEGWGVPAGGVRAYETPFRAAHREFEEETNIFGGYSISDEPIAAFQKQNGHIGLVFMVNLDPYTELPKQVRDPIEHIKEAVWADPLNDFEHGMFREMRIYKTHLELINMSASVAS